jgi:hypothetical protein
MLYRITSGNFICLDIKENKTVICYEEADTSKEIQFISVDESDGMKIKLIH